VTGGTPAAQSLEGRDYVLAQTAVASRAASTQWHALHQVSRQVGDSIETPISSIETAPFQSPKAIDTAEFKPKCVRG
jgi:hypothetical protein